MFLLRVNREKSKREDLSSNGVRNRRLTVISYYDSCYNWWDHPVILAGSPVGTLYQVSINI
jgi:hypothetical protein